MNDRQRLSTYEIRKKLHHARENVRLWQEAGNTTYPAMSWGNYIANLEQDLIGAESASFEITDEYRQMDTRQLVKLTMDIGESGDGLMAERELIRRVRAQPEDGHLQGPARLVALEGGHLTFHHIDPSTNVAGRFLAYDVGYWD